ncbi:hypothetical protein AB0K45_09635 [Micrococcus luteus]|uniref:hypothetical protein n=1 Tax=Micrococcus luteus TaxID=1270 RepID=UPI003440E1D3
MTTCQHCRRPTQLYLCDDCTNTLHHMLREIPFLLDELDTRIQNLARITTGTIGRKRAKDTLNVVDFDAAEEARKVRKLLVRWVETVVAKHTGRTPPGLATVSTPDLARWLAHNITAIAKLDLSKKGRHELYDDIKRLVGDTQRGGTLVAAINPVEKHVAGPCPTVTGKDRDGTPRLCGQMLFADTYDQTVDCPRCEQTIDVEENRRRAAADRDLHTRTDLLEVLANIDEPVTDTQLDAWIKARRLRPRGYLHDGAIVEFRVTERDEPVYSIRRVQRLRERDAGLRSRLRHRQSA